MSRGGRMEMYTPGVSVSLSHQFLTSTLCVKQLEGREKAGQEPQAASQCSSA